MVMDFHEDSYCVESLRPVAVRNMSSSSSVFYSANQSPFFSPRSPASQSYEPQGLDKPSSGNKSSFRSTAAENPHSSGAVKFTVPDASRSSAPSILSDLLLKADNANSSTGTSGSTFYSYGQESANGYFECREKFNKPRRSYDGSLTLGSAALTSSSRLRSCDIFIGFHGRKSSLTRFVNWLCADLEAQGLRCYATDRGKCRNSRKRRNTEKAMDISSFGIVILTRKCFKNPFTIEELRFFSGKRNLVPIYFDLSPGDCMDRDMVEKRGQVWEKDGGELWLTYGGLENEWREAISALSRVTEWKLEAQDGNWRDCIYKAVTLITERLGRRSIVDRLTKWHEKVESEEFPFPRNENFVGRKKELSELELMLFGESSERDFIDLKARPPKRKNLMLGWGRSNPGGERWREQNVLGKNRKGKDLVVWKESDKDIEMLSSDMSQTPSRSYRLRGNERHGRRRRSMVLYGKGVACVSGEAGIGKTELLLEFAYRYQQRYKMVLWIEGESTFMRNSYLNLGPFLGVNVGFENSHEKGKIMSFKEQEEAAISKIRKELMRNVPVLVIIDNLESEKDFWDHKLVMDLLPRFGGEAHIIVSTRLPRVLNLEPLKLSYLSEVESMSLMQAGVREYSVTETDALKAIEEKLGRLTLGLAIVGSILSELPISPSTLLPTICRMPLEHVTLKGKDSHPLKANRFLLQLLEVCFSIFDHADGPRSLATRMVQVGGWFAPAPTPVSLLASAAHKIPSKHRGARLWQKLYRSLSCGKSSKKKSEAEAASMLIRFNLARSSCMEGHLHFNNLIKLYARKRGVSGSPQAMVQAIISRGQALHHSEHFWAACFLVFGFGTPVAVELKVTDLLLFVKQVVLPLAIRSFITLSRCGPALELLRLCTEVLEQADQAFVTPVEKMVCCAPIQTTAQMNPFLWQELALSRATVLETRAKLMLRVGEFDIGDDLIRKAIFIRTSIYGEDHPDTQSAKETLRKFTRLQAQRS
uniref:TIR domain-containing protein n=1 Tax=Kalanchoe fedtschenkoi TaxID=63787 RepID=A0A7N0URC9_KALFE